MSRAAGLHAQRALASVEQGFLLRPLGRRLAADRDQRPPPFRVEARILGRGGVAVRAGDAILAGEGGGLVLGSDRAAIIAGFRADIEQSKG